MASPTQVRRPLTLEEFLELPEDKPYLEYIDGRIEPKVSPQFKHGWIQYKLADSLNRHAEPAGLGFAVPELRCTFAGRSIVPDVVFLLEAHVENDGQGEFRNEVRRPPDLHVEVISPDQSARASRETLLHSTSNGCLLGWLIDPEKKTVDVFRPGREPERLDPAGSLDGDPVLPGYRLAVAEVFGWLKRPGPAPNVPPAPGADPA